jgi:hypothetical protein
LGLFTLFAALLVGPAVRRDDRERDDLAAVLLRQSQTFRACASSDTASHLSDADLRCPPKANPETSRFPNKELPHMPGSPTTPGWLSIDAMAAISNCRRTGAPEGGCSGWKLDRAEARRTAAMLPAALRSSRTLPGGQNGLSSTKDRKDGWSSGKCRFYFSLAWLLFGR